jgi:hypothetical protein
MCNYDRSLYNHTKKSKTIRSLTHYIYKILQIKVAHKEWLKNTATKIIFGLLESNFKFNMTKYSRGSSFF